MSTETVDGRLDLPGLPKSISRARYIDERCHVYLAGEEVATHRVCIPVSDGGVGVRFRPTGGGCLQMPPPRAEK